MLVIILLILGNGWGFFFDILNVRLVMFCNRESSLLKYELNDFYIYFKIKVNDLLLDLLGEKSF